MGDFFEDLGKRISETAEVVTKKTEEVVELQKLKNQIRNMERNNERDLRDLGKMVYEKYQVQEVLDPEVTEICEMIEKREEAIADYEKEIAKKKTGEICESCHVPVSKEMQFCPQCGTKIVREEPQETASDCECECEAEDEFVKDEDFVDEVERSEVPEEGVEAESDADAAEATDTEKDGE